MLLRSIFTRLGLLKKVNIMDAIVINGKRFKMPVINGISSGYTEKWMVELLKNLQPLFRKNFVDAGVNMGQTLLKVQAVYPGAAYLGFEPNSTCVYYVQKLIAANGFSGCEIIPAAVADQPAVLKLNYYAVHDEADESATILENFRPDQKVTRSLYVAVLNGQALNGVLPQGEPAFLKVDVEGAELEVIRGLQPWIAVNQPVILMEILPVYTAENTERLQRQQQLEQIFKSLNYLVARVNKQNTAELRVLDEIGICDDMELGDYVIFHASRRSEIEKHFRLQ